MKKMYLLSVIVLFLSLYLPGQDIFSAIQKGDLASVKALLEKDPTLINFYANGSKPLHFAAKLNQKDIAEYLVSKGADINVNESAHLDFTPVTFAIRNGNMEMVGMFLKNGANVQYRTWLGESYLHFAAFFDRKELAAFLIERGIDINTAKNGGLTPMHMAVVAGNIDIIKLLVQKGANLELKSKDGGTPLHFAEAARKDEIADFLRQSGAKDIPREFPEYKGKYLGMKEPGTVPEAFAPELFLDIYRSHSAPAFSPDGKEIYWTAIFMPGNNDIPRVWGMKEVNGKWQAPQVAPLGDYPSGGPVFSHDGQKLFFFSMRPRTNEPAKDLDLWYVERQGNSWGEPKHLDSPLNEDGVFENDPFLAKDGTLYFEIGGGKNAGLYKSAYVNGKYAKPEFLGDLFNSSSIDNCGDREHIILRSDRRKERFHFELYMSFHLPDGRWSKPIYMGDHLHQGKRSGYGRVTPDKKYLFIERDFSFYWVSSKIIEGLRPKSDFPKLTGPYLGQTRPGMTPEHFGVGVIDNDERVFAITFSPDGKECFYTKSLTTNTIMTAREINGRWSEPAVAGFSGKVFDFEPHITPDGKKMIFGSMRALSGMNEQNELHQWVIGKKDDGWSEPKSMGSPFDDGFCMYVSVAINENIYFTGKDGIYLSEFSNGKHSTPIKLSQVINDLQYAAHPFIAPDESYLIFDAQPQEGNADLFISFRNHDGTWASPLKFDTRFNTDQGDMCAFVTHDGRYFFFSRLSKEKGDVYWVSAKILEEMRPRAGGSVPLSGETQEKQAPKLSEKLFVVKPFLGPTWTGTVPNDSRMGEITLKWDVLLNGFAVRLKRNILKFDHWLETTYYWDESSKKIAYLALSNNGVVIKGFVVGQGDELISEGDQRGSDVNRKVRRTYKLDKDGKLYEDDQFRDSDMDEWRRTHVSIFVAK